MTDGKILIIDDNKGVLSALKLLLQREYKTITAISNPNQITSFSDLNTYNVILLDMNFSAGLNTGNEGFYWLKRIKEISSESSVIMITAHGSVALAVRSLKEGATDFILKPWDNKKLLATIQSAYHLGISRREIKGLKEKETSLKSIINQNNKQLIGTSTALLNALKITRKVAKTNANILITGENGTGKELIAKEVHRCSDREKEILVTVDMASLPDSLIESELFGHVKGAFTDAKEDRQGKFELAQNGTLFLDEIGNIPLHIQVKLLSVLQNREVTRVGSNRKIPLNIRLVCATNSDLDKMVEDGQFREDLLYRINTILVEVPPLREREEDVLLLAEFFLKKYAQRYGKEELKLNKSTRNKLLKHHWPGNIRELQHTMERCVLLSEGNILNVDEYLVTKTYKTDTVTYDQTLDDMEKTMISNALKRHHGNYSSAANQLGVTRQTLYNKTKRYNL